MARASGHIPFCMPWTGRQEIRQVTDAVRSGWLTTGPKVALFEERIRRLVRARHAVALNSCTAALHLSLAAAGVKKEVLPKLVAAALADPCHQLNPRPVTRGDFSRLFAKAWAG